VEDRRRPKRVGQCAVEREVERPAVAERARESATVDEIDAAITVPIIRPGTK
jgi:hypothetical protein